MASSSDHQNNYAVEVAAIMAAMAAAAAVAVAAAAATWATMAAKNWRQLVSDHASQVREVFPFCKNNNYLPLFHFFVTIVGGS